MTGRAWLRGPVLRRRVGRASAAAVAMLTLVAAPCLAQAPQRNPAPAAGSPATAPPAPARPAAPTAATPAPAAAAPAAGPVDVAGAVHVCSSCHGPGGRSISSTFPRLAGQQKDYLEAQLKAFRDHTRADPHAKTYMWGMAAQLSNELIAGIAEYYAKQPPVPGSPDSSVQADAGRKIYTEGIPAESVPACKSCHGDHAEGNSVIPRLAGQHRDYIERQLEAFASNARTNEVMHENSVHLTPDQIGDVAAYVRTQ